jgi:predicted nucleic acid-binding protein
LIVADSSVWIDYFNGVVSIQTNKLEDIIGKEYIALTDHILLEVLRGFKRDAEYNTVKSHLKKFPCYNALNFDMAVKCAENYRYLKSLGITIRSTIDLVIGTFCIENDIQLLHSDKDFNPLEKYLGLKVVN